MNTVIIFKYSRKGKEKKEKKNLNKEIVAVFLFTDTFRNFATV